MTMSVDSGILGAASRYDEGISGPENFEAPWWSPDEDFFLGNSDEEMEQGFKCVRAHACAVCVSARLCLRVQWFVCALARMIHGAR